MVTLSRTPGLEGLTTAPNRILSIALHKRQALRPYSLAAAKDRLPDSARPVGGELYRSFHILQNGLYARVPCASQPSGGDIAVFKVGRILAFYFFLLVERKKLPAST
jgi:hypothetical protein